MKSEELLAEESRRCFDFFWLETNDDKDSPGFGLIRDRVPGSERIASIASVGFGLSALAIGVEKGWIDFKQGYDRALGTLRTLYHRAQHYHGFFFHFLDMQTAQRAMHSEVSIIDTGIVINGAITAGEYFGNEVRDLADRLYVRVQWEWYRDRDRNLFYMGYTPEKGFSGWWDFYAEQMMIYILGAGSPTYPVSGEMFYRFARVSGQAKEYPPFIHSWYGSIFTHQYTHAWVDFRSIIDDEGIDWWDNSLHAVRANRQYCINMGARFKTLGCHAWGLTPCDGPWGYNGRYGAAPSAIYNNEHYIDGTIAPAGAAGSIVFTPKETMEALHYYYENHPQLWGRYGFKDALNMDIAPVWYAEGVIGIDKGITLLMIENYLTEFIWKLYMKNERVRDGLNKTGFRTQELRRFVSA